MVVKPPIHALGGAVAEVDAGVVVAIDGKLGKGISLLVLNALIYEGDGGIDFGPIKVGEDGGRGGAVKAVVMKEDFEGSHATPPYHGCGRFGQHAKGTGGAKIVLA